MNGNPRHTCLPFWTGWVWSHLGWATSRYTSAGYSRIADRFYWGQHLHQLGVGDGVGKLDQLAELQFVVTLLGARMVRLAGQEVPPRDQLVPAYLGIPSDAERIHTKGLGQIVKPIIYVG